MEATQYIANLHAKDEEPLPHGWVELYDEGYQQVYYYNQETGESSWQRPTQKATVDAAAFEGMASAPCAPKAKVKSTLTENRKQQMRLRALRDQGRGLWESVQDPHTGTIKYRHNITKDLHVLPPQEADRLDSLVSLKLLDLCHNKLSKLPPSLGNCWQLDVSLVCRHGQFLTASIGTSACAQPINI